MEIVRLSIEAESPLVETISDYLIGIMGMVVEFQVNEEASVSIIHGFLTMDSCLPSDIDVLVEKTHRFCREMAEIFRLAEPKVRADIIPNQDWSKNWKEYFKPFELIPGLVIAPSWEEYKALPGQDVIIMDPGMAFGTGHHATTKLCLEMIKLSADLFAGKHVLDVGTGTGILGMAAVMWGAAGAVGIDNDKDAVIVANDNVRRNNLHHSIMISDIDLREINRRYPLVVANIIYNTLIALAEDLCRVVDDGGVLILSGLVYGEQTENIIECFTEKGLTGVNEQEESGWGVVMFTKPG